MRTAYRFGKNLLVLMFLSSFVVPFAQTQEMKAPTFSLAIEEGQLSAQAGYQPNDHKLIVKYTNASDGIQNDGCMVTPSAYKILVLRDGVTAEKRKSKKQIQVNDEEKGKGVRIKVTLTESDSCQRFEKGLKPGESVTFPLWVSSEYDMTLPGTYEITVTRETDRWNHEKSVTVKSNTLTIVVPEAGVSAPQ